MDQFDAIRPYRDDEVPGAIDRLLQDQEFLGLVAGFKAPTWSRRAPHLVKWGIRRWLNREYGRLSSVEELQSRLAGFVEQVIEASTRTVTQTGLENLDKATPYLFLSNHRDIVFDPMIVNFLLFRQGMRTARIAIGDNLLGNQVFAELMRLNKSFLVRRNVTSAREMRDAFLLLSAFIHHSIEESQSVWIAQREGRAKSGIDRTDPAIIKMFYMSRKKAGIDFADAMNQLNIVPVSISYEFDPCDGAKARELETRDRTGQYVKQPSDDTDQILLGMSGFKGHVHVHFGEPITDSPEQPAELAAVIDREISGHYRLHPSNLAAYGLLEGISDPNGISHPAGTSITKGDYAAAQAQIRDRLAAYEPALHPYILKSYANPVLRALEVAR